MTTALNRAMIESAFAALEAVKGSCCVLFVDALDDWTVWKTSKRKKRIILVTQSEEAEAELKAHRREVRALLRLPAVRLTRLAQIKLSVIMCVTEGILKGDDRAVFLTGVAGSGALDTVMALDLAKESEVFSGMEISLELVGRIKPAVLETVLNIALDLAGEGREGKAVGTTFVIGDNDRVTSLSRPLILNPFKGYPEEARNILDEKMRETIKEFSLLDGAFVIREDVVVMAAGVHLDAALEGEGVLPGLGCRHMAAAGITDVTDAVSVSISGSTGIIRIFRKGKVVLEIERPAPGMRKAEEGQ